MIPTNNENILSLFNSISIGFFGIGATVFTVLYAFILDKKDKIVYLLDQKQKRNLSIFEERELSIAKHQMNKYKQIGKSIKLSLVLSFLLFIISLWFYLEKVNKYMSVVYLLLAINIIVIIYIMYLYNSRFNKETRI